MRKRSANKLDEHGRFTCAHQSVHRLTPLFPDSHVQNRSSISYCRIEASDESSSIMVSHLSPFFNAPVELGAPERSSI